MRFLYSPALPFLFLAIGVASALDRESSDRLIVHEWGTFTTLQDEQGHELTGVNVDDEPVPPFVHNLHPYLLGKPVLSHAHWFYRMKGAPRRHPLVTMRLETPVIYMYPPAGTQPKVDVSVQFRGGWLSEFYPHAEANAPGLKQDRFDFGHLSPETVSSLTWRDVQVGGEGNFPNTDWPVWLAPRNVDSATLTTPSGESERYLFYRGIGRQRAPLRVTTDRKAQELSIFSNFAEVLSGNQTAAIPDMWLVDIRDDGTSAFRIVPGIDVTADSKRQLAETGYSFEQDDYSADHLQELKTSMHAALMEDGLYADEATALLNTWQRAYFKSPGLRLFFLVPRVWTDHYLPLQVSEPAEIERVMVGRIELITDQQRHTLDELSQTTVGSGKWLNHVSNERVRDQLFAGRTIFEETDLSIPPEFQLYLSLGRFRNALVVAEERQRPTESLTRLINEYRLQPYRWPGQPRTAAK